jgi:hypothetical protein
VTGRNTVANAAAQALYPAAERRLAPPVAVFPRLLVLVAGFASGDGFDFDFNVGFGFGFAAGGDPPS